LPPLVNFTSSICSSSPSSSSPLPNLLHYISYLSPSSFPDSSASSLVYFFFCFIFLISPPNLC
jgi:hypothetical protein